MKDNLIFGIHPVLEALEAGKDVDRVFIQKGLNNSSIDRLKTLLKAKNQVYQSVPKEKLNRLTNKNHQGVVCFITDVEFYHIGEIIPAVFEKGETPLVLILDRITDVRNFGAIARTAECAGVNAIIIPSRGAAQVNGDAVKTSAGALHKIPVCRENNLKDTLRFLKESGLKVIACTEKTERTIYESDLSEPLAILLGSEENGISGEYLKMSDELVKIPMSGSIESLNVSVAAGVILFETIRQRLQK